jgi:hypothetical protein
VKHELFQLSTEIIIHKGGVVLRMDKNRICATSLMWQTDGKRKVGRSDAIWRRVVETKRDKLGERTSLHPLRRF